MTIVQSFTPTVINISDAALQRLKVLATENQGMGYLRIYISGGGCSGFRYCFDLEGEREADDTEVVRDGAKVLIDSMSIPYIKGSTLDYLEDLQGSRFAIQNPQAKTTCGCGESFSI